MVSNFIFIGWVVVVCTIVVSATGTFLVLPFLALFLKAAGL